MRAMGRIWIALLGALLVTGCGGRNHTDASRHHGEQPPSVQTKARILRALGYVPVSHVTVSAPSPLLVFHSVCSGSADGHCQAVQAFTPGRSHPIWTQQYADVRSLRATSNGFTVTSAHYAKSDPLCCPSLPPTTQTFRWDGSHVAPE